MDCTFLHTQIGPKEADFFDVFSGKLLECAICHRGMFQAYVLPSGFVGPGFLQACDPHICDCLAYCNQLALSSIRYRIKFGGLLFVLVGQRRFVFD